MNCAATLDDRAAPSAADGWDAMERRSTGQMIETLKRIGEKWAADSYELIAHALRDGAQQVEVCAPTHKKLDSMTASVYITRDGKREAYATFLSRGFPHAVGEAANLSQKDGINQGTFCFELDGNVYNFEVAIGPRLNDWVILGLRSEPTENELEQPFEELESPAAQRFLIMSSALIQKAHDLAREDFRGHARKVPSGSDFGKDEYFTHLHAVATIMAEYEFDAEVIAAAYLHDHLEDLPQKYSKADLTRLFSPRVAELVDWVTQQDKSQSWEDRNSLYNERLKAAPAEAMAISAADKLSNILDTIPFLKIGYPVDSILKRGWQANSEKFHDLLDIYRGNIPDQLYARVEAALEMFDRFGRENQ